MICISVNKRHVLKFNFQWLKFLTGKRLTFSADLLQIEQADKLSILYMYENNEYYIKCTLINFAKKFSLPSLLSHIYKKWKFSVKGNS